PAEAYEISGAKCIGFKELDSSGALPGFSCVGPEVSPARPLITRTDTVFPVIAVGTAAAWPTNDRCMNAAHCVDQSGPDRVCVWNAGTFADPDAIVNNAAEVFCEVSIDVR